MRLKLITFLFIFIFLTGCSPQAPITASTAAPVDSAPSEMSSPATTEAVSTAPPETAQLTSSLSEIPSQKTEPLFSPRSIRTEAGFLIVLIKPRIEIHPNIGTYYDLGFCYIGLTKGQIPEASGEYADSPFIKDLQIFRGADETPVGLEVIGTGTSQGTMENGLLKICENQVYQFPSDFVAGQAEQIVVLVTFHEMFGIAETVRYELDSVPLQGPLG